MRWGSVVIVALQLAMSAAAAGAQTAFPELVKQWLEPSLQSPSQSVENVKLSAGHVSLVLVKGQAAPVLVGGEVVGLFFRGIGSLEYFSGDPVEFPIVSYNVDKNTSLKVVKEAKQLAIRDTFEEVLWLAAGAELPVLSAGPDAPSLDASFARHAKKFGMAHTSPPCHQFPAWRRNGGARPLVRAEISGGAEDLIYLLDASEAKSESLCALRKNKQISHRLDLVVLSDQPVGRERRDPIIPRFALSDVDIAVTASAGKDVSLSATETFTAVAGRSGVLLLELDDTEFGRDALDERHLRVEGIFDEAGGAVPFDHRKDELAVGLAAPLVPGASVKLRFELEGDILCSPHGDSYWELGTRPWFPQPDLSGQYYKVHTVVRVPKPFVPFAPGKTIRRAEEGKYNVLETRIGKPVEWMVILAGKYAYEEETKNGLTIRVASYAGKSVNLRRLIDLSREMIAFYESLLGPFPFDEFNIVEIHALGFGQAPPAFMFITSEAFSPLRVRTSRIASSSINERLAHEIAHQYWGHVAKMPSLEEQWLTESFAEISAGLLIVQTGGKTEFDWLSKRWREQGEEATAIAPIPLAHRIRNEADNRAAWIARTNLLYGKGPALLNSIRLEIGDEAFFKFLRSCQASFTWKFGSTEMVEAVLKTVTNKDWKPFFDAYYWGTGMPAK
jgi:aminopeptidase N